MTKRFIKLKKPGIRKDTKTGKYHVRKSVRGKEYSKLCDTVREAEIWRNSFDPLAEVKRTGDTPTLQELWEEYKKTEFPDMEVSSQETKKYQLAVLWDQLKDMELGQLTPAVISSAIENSKKKLPKSSKRCNYNLPLDHLKSILNWYRKNEDYTFVVPIQERHYKQGTIKRIPAKRKSLDAQDCVKFLNTIDKRMYQNLALIQLLTGCRISEAAGLQVADIDFEKEFVEIKNGVVWSRYNRKFVELKPYTKTGEVKIVPLYSKLLIEALREQASQSPNGFLFCTSEGEPLSYRMIQFQFNKALKKAGLESKAASTHFLRHSAATFVRDVLGLEAAQALLGHKDLRTTQIYAELPTRLIGDGIDSMTKTLEHLGLDRNKVGTKGLNSSKNSVKSVGYKKIGRMDRQVTPPHAMH